MEIPSEFPRLWTTQGYPRVHASPFWSYLSTLNLFMKEKILQFWLELLVDSRFTKYQHACIGTVENARVWEESESSSNVCVFLHDKGLLTALKPNPRLLVT
ncbi:Uncharacterized protein TCM_008955 [Theobroma cacao]|uniref:Uncharacterized protein n=1 Tax=Theobroma cacao TaxID=3641 RepID=A0A061ECB8_THECC|nr:Uncharacterized protein TCM_008955 [Theobroma cacao]